MEPVMLEVLGIGAGVPIGCLASALGDTFNVTSPRKAVIWSLSGGAFFAAAELCHLDTLATFGVCGMLGYTVGLLVGTLISGWRGNGGGGGGFEPDPAPIDPGPGGIELDQSGLDYAMFLAETSSNPAPVEVTR